MPEGQRHLTHPGRCQIHATGKSGLSDGAVGPGQRRASGGGGRRPVLPHAPVAQEDVRGHDGPAHDRGHGGPGCPALSRSRPYSAFISGPDMQAAIAAMHGTSPGRLRPPPMWRPPLSVPLSRAKGATPPGTAAWRLAVAPGPPIQATGDAAVTGPMPGTGAGMRWLSARPCGSLTSSPVRRPYPLTAAAGSSGTPVTGPSGSGSPTPAGTASARRAGRRGPPEAPACRGACRRSRPPAPLPPCPGGRREQGTVFQRESAPDFSTATSPDQC